MHLLDQVLETVVTFVLQTIESGSYFGIIVLMGLESANIPIPSEVIMPFSGFLASQGKLDLHLAAWAGAIGCTIGSLLSYWLGLISDKTWVRGFVAGWGRFFITEEELERAERWFARYGDQIVFTSRLLPVVRTFISFPAGMAKVNLLKFTIYSFVGSLIWSYFLAWIGFKLGENWQVLRPFFRQFDYLIVAVAIIGLVGYLYHRGRKFGRASKH
ncbi:MAG TPA: DedA family protein [Patescibacteria group bacterium]|nr:DedA family protein [Patescibacteria group bacterium]